MGISDLKKLVQKENRLFLILIIWLLICIAAMEISKFIKIPVIGVLIFLPFLTYTLFLYFISFSKKNLKEYSFKKLFGLLLISLLLIPLLIIAIVVLFVFSIFSYILMTSIFILYGCYKGGKKRDEQLFYKKNAWLSRGLEFWGGLALSIILILVFAFASVYGINIAGTRDTMLVVTWAYIIIIIVIAFLTVLSLLSMMIGRLNAWLGTYFLFIAIYTLYLILKVFIGLSGGTGDSSTITTVLILLLMDIFILIYTISGILGTQTEVLSQKLKIRPENVFFWLLFSKAAWEFAVNFPYESFDDPAIIADPISVIGSVFSLISSIAILALFIILTLLFGIYGILTYGKDKKRMKKEKEKKKIIEVIEDIEEGKEGLQS